MGDPLVRYFPQLGTMDLESTETKVYTILYTIAFFTIVFFLSFLGSFTFHTFKNVLRPKEKIFWCLAFVRGVFGIFSSIVGIYYLVFDDTLKKDIVNAKTALSVLSIYVTVGFFVFECLALYVSNIVFRFFDKFLFLHHTLSLLAYSVATYYVKGGFFAATGLVLEGSTPFTCLCWMLLKADLAHTRLWTINQMILVHIFHCRSMVETYFVFITYYQWDTVWAEMPPTLFWCVYIQLPLQLLLLTPYWTYKKTQQLMDTKPMDFNHNVSDASGKKGEGSKPRGGDRNGVARNGKQHSE